MVLRGLGCLLGGVTHSALMKGPVWALSFTCSLLAL